MKEDIYFITGMPRKGEDGLWFPKIPIGIVSET